MKYVVLDLEMNPISKRCRTERKAWRDEIIEIGAILLNEQYEEIASYMTYVKPQMSDRISDNISKLTGITTEDVQEAPPFEEAWDQFYTWCMTNTVDDVQVITWSDNDQKQILMEMLLKNYQASSEEISFVESWYDFQREYDDIIGFDRNTSLKNAVFLSGADFKGRQHDALVDARNTAHLFQIVRVPSKREEALGSVIDAMKEKTLGSFLGDFFDFGSLNLAS